MSNIFTKLKVLAKKIDPHEGFAPVIVLVIVACLVLLTGVFLYFERTWQKGNTSNPIESNASAPHNDSSTVILTKQFAKIKIGAYKIKHTDVPDYTFTIGPVYDSASIQHENGMPIISIASIFYPLGEVFDVVGEQIYVVNSLQNSIDVYTGYSGEYSATKPNNPPVWFSVNVISPKSLPLPDGSGRVYGIKCSQDNCLIKTGMTPGTDQARLCQLTLNIPTNSYSKPICINTSSAIKTQ